MSAREMRAGTAVPAACLPGGRLAGIVLVSSLVTTPAEARLRRGIFDRGRGG